MSKQSKLDPILKAELNTFARPNAQKKTSFIFKVTSLRCFSIKNFLVFRLTRYHMTNVTIILRRVMIASVPHTTGRGLAIGLVVENTIIMIIHMKKTQVGATVELNKKKREKLPFSSRLAMSESTINFS